MRTTVSCLIATFGYYFLPSKLFLGNRMARVGEALRFACPVHVTGPCTRRPTFRPAMRPVGSRRLGCDHRVSQARNKLFARAPAAQDGSSHPAQEEEVTPLLDAPLVEVAQLLSAPKELGAAIDGPGIYAIYSSDGTLQYIGLSRKVTRVLVWEQKYAADVKF